jgi:hypothetical protein
VEISKKQAEFWAFVLMMCIAVSCVVLLVDFGIKAAILEESNKLRLTIEEEEVRRSGRRREEANANGIVPDAPVDAPIPGHVLVVDAAGMEETGPSNGAAEPLPAARIRRPKSGRPATDRAIPSGDK